MMDVLDGRCATLEIHSTRSWWKKLWKLSRSFPEAYLSTVQLFNCDILISSCCVTKMTNLDEKFTDEEVNETF